MRILHVITSLKRAAGTSVFCAEVCNGLVAAGHEVTVADVDPDAQDCYPIDQRVKLISISSLLRDSTRSTRLKFDLVHIHALWSPILHRAFAWARKNKILIVWSPHGMLTPWAMNNKKWKKRLGWWLYQKRDLSHADLIHATAQSEVEDLRRMGLKNNVMVVPLGVKVNNRVERVERVDGKKVLLFVSRVQKKKGLLNLVRAWARLEQESSTRSTRSTWLKNWKVRIIGPDEDGHTAELKELCSNLKVENDFEFVGPKYGDDLAREYASADLFVLPTHSENFGSVVIEALAHSVPVICTTGAPWEELETYKCGWWIDIGEEPLARALQEAISLDDASRREVGTRGRKLVEEKYTWSAVVKRMMNGYIELAKSKRLS